MNTLLLFFKYTEESVSQGSTSFLMYLLPIFALLTANFFLKRKVKVRKKKITKSSGLKILLIFLIALLIIGGLAYSVFLMVLKLLILAILLMIVSLLLMALMFWLMDKL